jgi:hypothetical protein
MTHIEALQTLGGSIALLKAQATRTLEFCQREASQIFGGKSFTRGRSREERRMGERYLDFDWRVGLRFV